MEILNTENITNLTVRNFLEEKLFPNLRKSLQELVNAIHDNGDLDMYWEQVEKKNEEARRAARRLEKERKRLEMGSDYEDSSSQGDDSLLEGEIEEGEYEEEEDEEEEEEESEFDRNDGVDEGIREERMRRVKKKKKENPQPVFKFDAVRFLARVLKNLEDNGEIPERQIWKKPGAEDSAEKAK
ncbi:unnamed protein product [Moneuplotes crassus]|uniref:Uncharacterized protein n=2 Tax=Euplotes crassus TaxID=5936 RepID=A0AAD2D6G8_EUPCR|nr:unnamed protein product [Moneuplotes crassus]